MIIFWGLLLCLLLMAVVRTRPCEGETQENCTKNTRCRKELQEKRTALYELLLYARKKYRETGERSCLSDIQTLQEEISACDKALRQTLPED